MSRGEPRHFTRVLVILAALLAGTSVRADNDRGQAQRLVSDGSRAFEAGQYQKALDRFLAAYQIFKSPRILFDLGQTELKLDNKRAAATYFHRFAATSEGDDASRQEAAAALSQLESGLGRLHLDSDAPGVQCSVDGEHQDDTLVYVTPGTHVVEATADGKMVRLEVTAAAGELHEVRLAQADMVAPDRAHLDVRSTPTGAAIRVDGVEQGAAPTIADVASGDHQIEARLAGYESATRQVTAPAGATLRVDLSLSPRPDPDAPPAVAAGPAPARSGRLWTWVAGGVAVAAAGGGVGFGLGAEQASKTLLAGSRNESQANARLATATNRVTAANVCWVTAGVAAAAAVGLFFIEGTF